MSFFQGRRRKANFFRFFMWVCVCALAIWLIQFAISHRWAPNTPDLPATNSQIVSQAKGELDRLKVSNAVPQTKYDRGEFGKSWADVDNNGCDTRNDILHRDLKDVKTRGSAKRCQVVAGTLADPYTGKTIKFARGPKTSQAVQIDHVVALENAWRSGASGWNETKRENFANDPVNLLAVDGLSNQAKGSRDAAAWLPSNTAFRCEYVARQIVIKKKYQLSVTPREKTAMKDVLSRCK